MPSATSPMISPTLRRVDSGVVPATADPQQDHRDGEQDQRDDVVLDPLPKTGGPELLGQEHDRVRRVHDGSSRW